MTEWTNVRVCKTRGASLRRFESFPLDPEVDQRSLQGHVVNLFYYMAMQLTLKEPNEVNKLKFCVYVLRSLKDNKFYIGFTTDLNQRLTSHIKGESKATAFRRPFKLIFCEYFLAKKDALRREKYFKTTMGKKMLKLSLKEGLKNG